MRLLRSPRDLLRAVAALSVALAAALPTQAAETTTARDLTRQTTGDIIGAGVSATKSSTFERPQYVLGPEKWGSQVLGTAGQIPWSFFDPANGGSRQQPNGLPYISLPMKA